MRRKQSSGCKRERRRKSRKKRLIDKCAYMYLYTCMCNSYTTHVHTHTHTHTHTQERSVQSDAGGLLGEVKRKLSDIHYHIKLVNALKELREYRREAHRKTGTITVCFRGHVYTPFLRYGHTCTCTLYMYMYIHVG